MRFPKHPFAVTTVFRDCFLVNFDIEPRVLAKALPSPLRPATYEDRAWLSIVIARMERMRPVFIPRALGITYNQIVYRAVVDCQGRRGVHFLRSDADNPLMAAFGNAMSFFRFHRSEVSIRRLGSEIAVDVRSQGGTADIHARFDLARRDESLPSTSRFRDLNEAKNRLVQLFDAYHPSSGRRTIDVVSIDRSDWVLSVVPNTGTYRYMEASTAFPAGSAHLDSIFYVQDLRYRWHRLATIPRRA